MYQNNCRRALDTFQRNFYFQRLITHFIQHSPPNFNPSVLVRLKTLQTCVSCRQVSLRWCGLFLAEQYSSMQLFPKWQQMKIWAGSFAFVYGTPQSIVCDADPIFLSNFFRNFLSLGSTFQYEFLLPPKPTVSRKQ